MPSPNLAITHVASAQNQKEITINDAVDALDRAITDVMALDFAGGTTSLSAAQLRAAAAFQPLAALSGPATLGLPQFRRVFVLINTDGSFPITVERGDTGIVVEPGETAVLICDGSPDGVFRAGSGTAVYDFGMLAHDTPGPAEVLGKVVLPRAILIPADLAGSVLHVDTSPDAAFEISMTVNGIVVATATIQTDGSTTFATAGTAPIAIAAGDVVRFLAPASTDASIAGIALTVAARRLA